MSERAGVRVSAKTTGVTLSVRGLIKHYPAARRILAPSAPPVRAVDGVSFELAREETLGLVGESGCGKSTLGKTIAGLMRPTAGEIHVCGRRIDTLRGGALREARRDFQVIFQDPYSSLNPRMSARDLVAEPLRNFGVTDGHELDRQVRELFEKVGLRADQMSSRPHEFSGGQRQRIGIARALALRPQLIICDEPVSALDVSVQAQVINLLLDLQQEYGLAYLFISHDLGVVEHVSHRVAVMYLGKIVEVAERSELFSRPMHPYTEALLSAIPVLDPENRRKRILLEGDIPSPSNPPSGCRFRTRCPIAQPNCAESEPTLREASQGHSVACHIRT